ncbi:hypothetical protein GDO86_001396 [Hymenochirus boettgeri]|uniref:Insulin-like domain-containing protein n=1 Tax=Hymenochirus boettgeri TaxID=247094 RepID=A0A8T2KFM3_9PIPI|nr:hypothetical protein GDO86_001396 [Hymenochirus boettgeri]
MSPLRGAVMFVSLVMLSDLLGEMEAQRSQVPPGDYGMKLCGREFIRAVIFTCGGSRWKRLSLGEESGDRRRDLQSYRHLTGDTIQDYSNKELNQVKLISLSEPRIHTLQNEDFPVNQQVLKESLNTYENYNDYLPITDDFSDYFRQVEDTSRKTQSLSEPHVSAQSDGQPWISSPRRRREMNIGVAGICCKWGCTKAEISTLC